MTIVGKTRMILVGVLATVALAIVPAAQAAPATQTPAGWVVCNEATAAFLGDGLVATDGDPATPARYQTNQSAMPGKGVGLANAAAHSPALSICADLTGSTGGQDGGLLGGGLT